jgi:hypothetical protein
MDLILKDAQRILDDCRENYLHPANNIRHPLHKETLRAITELEKIVFELTDTPKIKVTKKRK